MSGSALSSWSKQLTGKRRWRFVVTFSRLFGWRKKEGLLRRSS